MSSEFVTQMEKKMLHSSRTNRLLLFFLIFIQFTTTFAHSDDFTDDETVVEGI